MRLALALFLGCVPAASPSATSGPPGTITVDVRSRLAWPFALEGSKASLDGALMSSSATSAEEGMHTLSVMAVVSLRCSALSDHHATLRVFANNTFTLLEQPALVGVDVYATSDVTAPPEDRLRLRFTLRGAREGGSVYWPPPAACRGVLTIPAAICAVESLVEKARKNRDIIMLNCAYDKLKRLRETYDEATAKKLEQEAYQCVGEEIQYVETTRVVLEDRCGAELGFSEPRGEEPLRVPPPGLPTLVR